MRFEEARYGPLPSPESPEGKLTDEQCRALEEALAKSAPEIQRMVEQFREASRYRSPEERLCILEQRFYEWVEYTTEQQQQLDVLAQRVRALEGDVDEG